jgi:hypothetical protein
MALEEPVVVIRAVMKEFYVTVLKMLVSLHITEVESRDATDDAPNLCSGIHTST